MKHQNRSLRTNHTHTPVHALDFFPFRRFAFEPSAAETGDDDDVVAATGESTLSGLFTALSPSPDDSSGTARLGFRCARPCWGVDVPVETAEGAADRLEYQAQLAGTRDWIDSTTFSILSFCAISLENGKIVWAHPWDRTLAW